MKNQTTLQELEHGFEVPEEWFACFDRETGEVHTIDDETMRAADDAEQAGHDNDEDGSDERQPWMAELFDLALEVVRDTDAKRFVQLPTKWDFHEYRHMEDFIESMPNPDAQHQLWRAIKGRGAFRKFKLTADRLDVLDAWYAHRQSAIRELLQRWTEDHDITIEADRPPAPFPPTKAQHDG